MWGKLAIQVGLFALKKRSKRKKRKSPKKRGWLK